jgi:uncharacterized membrane protein YfcA
MIEIIILLLAGIGAGIVTGLVGASAVMVAAPLLIVFLDYPAYLAIGIALSIDIFASLFATLIYHKNGRIKIKPSLILLISSLVAVLIGSYFSKNIPSDNLGLATGIGIILAGLSIMIKKKRNISTKKQIPFFEKYKTLSLILVGLLIGTIAGVFGAGGGIMILLALVIILDYKTHEAIGTSVFLMIFIALFGGIAHYVNMPFSITSLSIGAGGGIIGAIFASKFANLLDEKILNKLVGFTIITLGVLLVLKNLFF